MAPRSLNRREYGQFKRMLEQALLEIRLPAGIVDTDNIVPGAVGSIVEMLCLPQCIFSCAAKCISPMH